MSWRCLRSQPEAGRAMALTTACTREASMPCQQDEQAPESRSLLPLHPLGTPQSAAQRCSSEVAQPCSLSQWVKMTATLTLSTLPRSHYRTIANGSETDAATASQIIPFTKEENIGHTG